MVVSALLLFTAQFAVNILRKLSVEEMDFPAGRISLITTFHIPNFRTSKESSILLRSVPRWYFLLLLNVPRKISLIKYNFSFKNCLGRKKSENYTGVSAQFTETCATNQIFIACSFYDCAHLLHSQTLFIFFLFHCQE